MCLIVRYVIRILIQTVPINVFLMFAQLNSFGMHVYLRIGEDSLDDAWNVSKLQPKAVSLFKAKLY